MIMQSEITCDVSGCKESIPIDVWKVRDIALSDAKEQAEQKGWLLIGKRPERSAQFCFECAKEALGRKG
jgi:hypothetical protein